MSKIYSQQFSLLGVLVASATTAANPACSSPTIIYKRGTGNICGKSSSNTHRVFACTSNTHTHTHTSTAHFDSARCNTNVVLESTHVSSSSNDASLHCKCNTRNYTFANWYMSKQKRTHALDSNCCLKGSIKTKTTFLRELHRASLVGTQLTPRATHSGNDSKRFKTKD